MGPEHLLAAQLIVGGFVDDFYVNRVFTFDDCLGDVERERCAAALVCPHDPAIDPNRAPVIQRFEVKQLPVVRFWNFECPLVPELFVWLEDVPNARQAGLNAVRNQKFSVPVFWDVGVLRSGALPHGIIPEAVKILPLLAYHLWPRVFAPGVVGCDLLGPTGFESVSNRFPLRGMYCRACKRQ